VETSYCTLLCCTRIHIFIEETDWGFLQNHVTVYALNVIGPTFCVDLILFKYIVLIIHTRTVANCEVWGDLKNSLPNHIPGLEAGGSMKYSCSSVHRVITSEKSWWYAFGDGVCTYTCSVTTSIVPRTCAECCEWIRCQKHYTCVMSTPERAVTVMTGYD
jgi:hypothetical protein